MRRIFCVVALLCLFPLGAAAAPAQEEPIVYVVKKGDTLWGISERFIKDPFYWPNLWSNNPLVANPHLIYPGQKLLIYDGRIEIVPVKPEIEELLPAPPEAAAAEEEAVPLPPEVTAKEVPLPKPREAMMIRTPGGGEGFVSREELVAAGVLIDTTDNRIMMAAGDTVFVDMKDLNGTRPGTLYSLFRSAGEVTHPITGAAVGVRIVELGTLKITEIHEEVATGVISANYREIERGARLRPYLPPRREVALKKASRELEGYIIAARDNQIALGQNDVVYVDLGTEDGLEKGNLLYISRSRQATELALERAVRLPDILLGAAVVVEIRPHTATALVLKSADAILRGDRVFTTVE